MSQDPRPLHVLSDEVVGDLRRLVRAVGPGTDGLRWWILVGPAGAVEFGAVAVGDTLADFPFAVRLPVGPLVGEIVLGSHVGYHTDSPWSSGDVPRVCDLLVGRDTCYYTIGSTTEAMDLLRAWGDEGCAPEAMWQALHELYLDLVRRREQR